MRIESTPDSNLPKPSERSGLPGEQVTTGTSLSKLSDASTSSPQRGLSAGFSDLGLHGIVVRTSSQSNEHSTEPAQGEVVVTPPATPIVSPRGTEMPVVTASIVDPQTSADSGERVINGSVVSQPEDESKELPSAGGVVNPPPEPPTPPSGAAEMPDPEDPRGSPLGEADTARFKDILRTQRDRFVAGLKRIDEMEIPTTVDDPDVTEFERSGEFPSAMDDSSRTSSEKTDGDELDIPGYKKGELEIPDFDEGYKEMERDAKKRKQENDARFGLTVELFADVVEQEQEGLADTIVEREMEKLDNELAGEPEPEEGGEREIPPHVQKYPQFKVIGPEVDKIPGFEEVYAEAIRDRRDNVSFPGESPATEQERELLTTIHAATVAVGDELGVDLRDRIPKVEDYHFFDSREAYENAVRERWGDKYVGGGGGHYPDVGTLWVRREDPVDNISGLIHETIHDVAMQYLHPSGVSRTVDGEDTHTDVDNVYVYNGYSHLNDLNSSGLTEIVTDMMLVKVSRVMGKRTVLFTYPRHDILGDAIVKKTVASYGHGLSVKEVDNMIVRGMLNGDMSGLLLVSSVLGGNVVDRLVNLTGYESEQDILQFAQESDLPMVGKTLQEVRAGKNLKIFVWD